jgi:hypothetical protein
MKHIGNFQQGDLSPWNNSQFITFGDSFALNCNVIVGYCTVGKGLKPPCWDVMELAAKDAQ